MASLYPEAVRLAPDLAIACKNLGVILHDNSGDPVEIVSTWERYLALVRDDPEAGAIRRAIEKLCAGG